MQVASRNARHAVGEIVGIGLCTNAVKSRNGGIRQNLALYVEVEHFSFAHSKRVSRNFVGIKNI